MGISMQPAPPNTSSQIAYERLRSAILSLEQSPGEILTERQLEVTLETSRTTVRAALARLEAEGLVLKGARGYTVAPIDLRDVRAACEWRESIEINAARLSVDRATPEQLGALRTQLERVRDDEPTVSFLRDATDFHVALARLSGNPFFSKALEDVLTRLSRARFFEASSSGGKTRAQREHTRILEHLENRDANLLETELKAHLARSRDRLLNALLERGNLQVSR
jgi:DNA-binding GntR family transcriptional regulator